MIGVLVDDLASEPLRFLLGLERGRFGRVADPTGGATPSPRLPDIVDGDAVLVGSKLTRRARRAGLDVAGAILDDVECNYSSRYRPIAERGRADFARWCTTGPEQIRESFAPLF